MHGAPLPSLFLSVFFAKQNGLSLKGLCQRIFDVFFFFGLRVFNYKPVKRTPFTDKNIAK